MSKYDVLWKWMKDNGNEGCTLSFCEIERIVGFPIDHSFLTYKKELLAYGYQVDKVSMKEKSVCFKKC